MKLLGKYLDVSDCISHPLSTNVKGTSEKLQRIFKGHGVPTYHKPFNTIRSQLVRPKDKSEKQRQCGLVYSMRCDQCPAEYVGETARTLGLRHKEHTTGGAYKNSAIWDHISQTGHSCSMENVNILVKQDNIYARKIHEALHIHTRKPTLNRDRGAEVPPTMLRLLSRGRPV